MRTGRGVGLVLVTVISCRWMLAANTTSIVLQASPSPVQFGQMVTLRATVTPASATGTVTFYEDGSNPIGIATLSSGVAVLRTGSLPFGNRALRARYNGDSANAASGSPIINLLVAVSPERALAAPVAYGTGDSPEWVVTGDFNGDGITDLAVANAGDDTVSVFLGSGSGVFQAGQTYVSGGNPWALSVGDFNGDGVEDLAVANTGDSTITVLLGNGDGTFQALQAVDVGTAPLAIVVADFNRDGYADAATANFSDNSVTILLGNGDGTFGAPATFSTGQGPSALAVADFNGDLSPDLAVANSNDTTESVTVLLGNGVGGFTAAPSISGQSGPYGVAVGDVNGDGKVDLVVADFGDYDTLQGGEALVLLGNGDGTFHASFASANGDNPQAVTVGDLNGDGKLDAVLATAAGVDILFGNGDGTFQPPLSYTVASGPVAVAVGSFTTDGLTDLAAVDGADGDVDVLLGIPGTCTFTLGPGTTTLDASAAALNLQLGANSPGCAWTVAAPAWLVPGAGSGIGTSTISVAVQANTSGAARTANIAIGGQYVTITQDETVQVFTDVAPNAYYFDAVNLLKQEGVTSGCTATQYCPLADITRAQMAVFIVRSVYGGDDFTASSIPYFTDVPPSTFGFQWIQKMYELGITSGCAPGLFCPTSSVTRDQMAVFIIRARFGAQFQFTYPTTPYFTDVPSNYWSFAWIQRMKQDAITSGCTATTYCPTNPVTRGDMAIFIMRGAFNQLLPPGTAVITGVAPSAISRGQTTTVSVTGLNTSFATGQTMVLPISGVTIGTATVTGPTTLTVELTPNSSTTPEPVSMVVSTGSQQAVGPNELIIQ